jgi:hypothetical protein
MFDPLSIFHDECIETTADMIEVTPKAQITKGFLSSLSSRQYWCIKTG